MSMRSCIISAAIASAALLFAVPSEAAVLNFEDLPSEFELQGVGGTVFSKGFMLRYTPAQGEPFPTGFFSVGPQWQFNGRSTALLANSCAAITTLTSQDNNPITLVSIDLAETNGDANVSVTFEGLTIDGELLRKTVNLRTKRVWQRVVFPPAFRRLQYVRWTQGDCKTNPPHMFDNVRVFQSWRGRED
jgi:hypothetical protein